MINSHNRVEDIENIISNIQGNIEKIIDILSK